MANLTKYFFKRTKTCNESVQISKFDSLVAKLGRVLTTKVYQLLTFEVIFHQIFVSKTNHVFQSIAERKSHHSAEEKNSRPQGSNKKGIQNDTFAHLQA